MTTLSARTLASQLGEWRPSGTTPIYEALADRIRLLILDGRITLGTRLPAERLLAEHESLSRTTVANAYARLRELGFAAGAIGLLASIELATNITMQRVYGSVVIPRFGELKVMRVLRPLTSLIPFAWLFATTPAMGIPIVVLAGMLWSGHELSSINTLLKGERTTSRCTCSRFRCSQRSGRQSAAPSSTPSASSRCSPSRRRCGWRPGSCST